MVFALVVPGSLPGAQAHRADEPHLDRTIARASNVVFAGRARPGAKVKVQVRKNRWKTVSRVRANKKGRYRTTVDYPVKIRSFRVKSKGQVSDVRKVYPNPTPAPEPAPEPAPAPVEPSVDPVVEREPAPVDECGERPQRADGSYYECSFHDEFDGTALDTSKWLVQETWYSGMTSGNKDCYVNNDDTIHVGDGVLEVTGQRELAPFTCRSPFGNFTATSTAGTVLTKGHFAQTYGRFSFRAKMPTDRYVPGAHSALWLYPEKPTYGQWPYSGEIDVAEWWAARPDNVYPSVHYAGENPALSTGTKCAMPTSSSDFHTYTVDWSPTQMKFYYDNTLCFTHAWDGIGVLTGGKPFDQAFNLVITQVWGNDWNAPGANSPTSATLTVDWARAWK